MFWGDDDDDNDITTILTFYFLDGYQAQMFVLTILLGVWGTVISGVCK